MRGFDVMLKSKELVGGVLPSLDIPSSSDLFIWPFSSAANSSIASSYLQGSVLPHTQETWISVQSETMDEENSFCSTAFVGEAMQ